MFKKKENQLSFEEGVKCSSEVMQMIKNVLQTSSDVEVEDDGKFFYEALFLFNTLQEVKVKAKSFLKKEHNLDEETVKFILENLIFNSISSVKMKNFFETINYYKNLGGNYFISYENMVEKIVEEMFLEPLHIVEYERSTHSFSCYIISGMKDIIKQSTSEEEAFEKVSEKAKGIIKEIEGLSLSFQDKIEEGVRENLEYYKKTIAFIRSNM